MASFILRRLITSVIALFVVAAIVFFLMRMLPGGPFDQDKALPAEIVASLERHYGLDQPVWKQFFRIFR